MAIQLSGNLENSIHAAVQSGRFASIDEAMNEAVRLLLKEINTQQPPVSLAQENAPAPNFIGAMREDAELLDEIVERAMKIREERPWRLKPIE